MIDEYLDLPGTREEAQPLIEVLVHHCECGCSAVDDGLDGAVSGACTALRALSDRRFVLGMLYGRHVRAQLMAEEWPTSTRLG